MSALDDDILGTELVTDLDDIATGRRFFYHRNGYRLPLQDAEKDAGLSEADIWRFLDETAQSA